MNVNIWGCRGSIARSHPSLIKYGGNTPCVEVVVEEDVEEGNEDADQKKETRIVLDMGSGAYDLGQKLVRLGPLKDQNILLTHCHWDHIQGFPFFAPLFVPGSHWSVHAPGGFTASVKEKLASQMSYEFFPLSIDMLGAEIDYNDLTEGQLRLGNVIVTSQYLNHPVLTLGYRLEAPDGTSMAYITDHEPYNDTFAVNGYKRVFSINPNDGSNTTADNGDDRHVDFLQDVDLLIHDAQYTAEEYKSKVGWGHGTIEYVTDIAMAAGVKKLVIFHHDPQRTDEQVEGLVEIAQKRARDAGSNLEVVAAADRDEICLPKKSGLRKKDPMLDSSAKRQPEANLNNHDVFVCHDNEGLFEGCKEDKIKMSCANLTNDKAWDDVFISKKRCPTLFIISCEAKYKEYENGADLCRGIRTEQDSDVPVVLLARNFDEKKKYERLAYDEGVAVTDWIIGPTPAYLRTRIRMAVARTPCRWIPPEIPQNEKQRLTTLRSLNVTETPEERFDAIVRLAKAALQVDSALLNLVDEDHQLTISCPSRPKGNPRVPRNASFCGHTILHDDIMIVKDTLKDNRFADNPCVTGGMKVRFYAGCPISIPSEETGEDYNVGSLCLVSTKPRKLTDHEQDLLRQFAALVRRELLSSGLAGGKMSIDC